MDEHTTTCHNVISRLYSDGGRLKMAI